MNPTSISDISDTVFRPVPNPRHRHRSVCDTIHLLLGRRSGIKQAKFRKLIYRLKKTGNAACIEATALCIGIDPSLQLVLPNGKLLKSAHLINGKGRLEASSSNSISFNSRPIYGNDWKCIRPHPKALTIEAATEFAEKRMTGNGKVKVNRNDRRRYRLTKIIGDEMTLLQFCRQFGSNIVPLPSTMPEIAQVAEMWEAA